MIYLGCDHAGYALKHEIKSYLDDKGLEYTDMGGHGEKVDYPDIAEAVCKEVLKSPDNRGILICGTGIGISIAANKIKGIRAALCADRYSAKFTRLHNDSNVICFGGRTMGVGPVLEMTEVFLNTKFMGGKHAARIEKVAKLEEKYK